MKKHFLFPGLLALETIFSFVNPPGKLIGRWQPKMSPGVSAVAVYRTDGTFDIFLNGKPFVNGTYRVSGDTLAISDPVCGRGYYGLYHLAFMGEDSVRQTLIQDTCTVRRNSVAKSPTMERIKTIKP